MTDTKLNILTAALRLFARDGYEAVSVSQIAGVLGMTKGALYKHYKSKRDIFDHIFSYICQLDVERSRQAGVPEAEFSEAPQAFPYTSAESLNDYMGAQFSYWTENEIACNFRRMVTLEQYRSPDMMAFYQKVMAGGPLAFIEDIFRETMKQGIWIEADPKQLAVEYYAPFYLFLSLSDAAQTAGEKAEISASYQKHLMLFTEKYQKHTE